MKQLGLFDLGRPAGSEPPVAAPPADLDRDRELASRIPECIRFGPSTWTFPGWAGIVYPSGIDKATLVRRGLSLASRHPLFRTVGIDRSYYAPLGDDELEGYASELPDGFRCVMKVWSEITTAVDPRSLEPNPRFLDADLCNERVLAPIARKFADHIGPIVFQLPPIPSRARFAPGRFYEALRRFFAQLPAGYDYAVELRNQELLTCEHLDTLASMGVAHSLSLWERMPTIGAQLDLPRVLDAPFAVARLSLPPGKRYAAQKASFEPFDRIVAEDSAMRRDVERLAELCETLGKPLFLVVNNKVEGSSPLTVRALLERLAARRTASAGTSSEAL